MSILKLGSPGAAGKLGKFARPDEETADSTGEFFEFSAETECELGLGDTYKIVSLTGEPVSRPRGLTMGGESALRAPLSQNHHETTTPCAPAGILLDRERLWVATGRDGQGMRSGVS